MLDHEVPPQAVTLARRKTLRVVLVLLALAALASPVIYYAIHRAVLRGDAQDELDRLAVPPGWVVDTLGDRYEGPMFGRTRYASITRPYRDVPDEATAIVAAGSQLGSRAGWTADNDYDAGSKAPSCRPYYDGCWAKGGYRLYLDVSSHPATPAPEVYRQFDPCPNPPNLNCTSLKLTIVYVP